ncbi:hypothetical protein ZOSMA_116G00110 [Zostera marina]|uniref:hAT-like transposase RNase-H fold domain-containing protein n=1 Tax=Zostera marina TaxID=29655 RepID=A0A0K9Q1X1_ZOSMR|nr:hypothetical protein ZOSMA_116G00110 [Zostera marina]
MSWKMKEKYEGECSEIVAIAVILDPRYKMRLIEFCYSKLFEPTVVAIKIDALKKILNEMYE